MRRSFCLAVAGAWLFTAAPVPAWEADAAKKILQDAAEKIKEKHERIQTKARLSVEASLGAQADCREYADELEGRRAEQLLAARLSLDIYKQGEGKPQAGAVTRDGKKVTVHIGPRSGGYAETHHDVIENARLIVFRGTRLGSARDILTNLQTFLHITPERYRWADELAGRVAAENPGARLVVTGHSLGGGLAIYAAMKHRLEGVVFNPAGFPANVVRSLSLSPADWQAGSRKITVFITRSEAMIDPVSALSLAKETTLAGRRYLVEEKSGLSLAQLHGMKYLYRHLLDTPGPITGCATDLGFQ